MKKIIFALFSILPLSFAALATDVGQLNGTYAFQMSGVKYPYGYYSNNKFIPVKNTCPINIQCTHVAMASYGYGTIKFDGLGKATFLSIASGDKGGPAVNTVWSYTVTSTNNILLGTASNGARLVLGNFNANGIAQTALIRSIDKEALYGTAILQE